MTARPDILSETEQGLITAIRKAHVRETTNGLYSALKHFLTDHGVADGMAIAHYLEAALIERRAAEPSDAEWAARLRAEHRAA